MTIAQTKMGASAYVALKSLLLLEEPQTIDESASSLTPDRRFSGLTLSIVVAEWVALA